MTSKTTFPLGKPSLVGMDPYVCFTQPVCPIIKK